MKLRVKDQYRNATLVYRKNEIIEIDDELGAWLCRDAPLIFEVVKQVADPPENKAVESPPVDKAAKPPGRRGRPRGK